MATSAYYAWRAAGSRWDLARPITDMVALAKRHGIAVLGTIGADDESHLQADFPEDHTPFSRTYWPVQAAGWVCACDLANSQGLGAAILRDARAGKLPWLKYMNFGGGHYEHTDGFRSRTWSGDEHVHLSCRSDWLTRGIGTYDPLAPPQEEAMGYADDAFAKAYDNTGINPSSWVALALERPLNALVGAVARLEAAAAADVARDAADVTRDAATLAAVKALAVATGQDPEAIAALIRAESEKTRAAVLAALGRAAQAEADALKG